MTTKQEILKEFEEKFGEVPQIVCHGAFLEDDIKSFLSTSLDNLLDTLEAGVAGLPNTYEDDEEAVFRTTKREVLALISSLRGEDNNT